MNDSNGVQVKWLRMLCLRPTRNSHLLLTIYKYRARLFIAIAYYLKFLKEKLRQELESQEFTWERTQGRMSRDMRK